MRRPCHIFAVTCLLLVLAASPKAQASYDSVLVYSITISGNKVTQQQVIHREIVLAEGEWLTETELKEKKDLSRQFLMNTRLFNDVQITDTITGSHVYIHIALWERWYIIPEPQISLADRNINEWLRHKDLYRITYGVELTHHNFRGRKEELRLSLIGGWRRQINLKYIRPYLNKKKTIGASIEAGYQQGHELGVITRNNNLQFLRVDDRNIIRQSNFALGLYFRPQYRYSHIVRAGLNYIKVDDTISRYENPAYLGDGRQQLWAPGISYQFIYDKREYVFYPLKGYYFSAVLEHKGLPQNERSVDINSIYVEVRKYGRVWGQLYYESGAQYKGSDKKTLPYIYRQPLGYRYLVRGYEHYLLEGQYNILWATQLRYKLLDKVIRLDFLPIKQFNKIPIRIFPKIFADAGYVYYSRPAYGNSLIGTRLGGIGAGLDVVTYYDRVLRLEYSRNGLGEAGLFIHLTEVF